MELDWGNAMLWMLLGIPVFVIGLIWLVIHLWRAP